MTKKKKPKAILISLANLTVEEQLDLIYLISTFATEELSGDKVIPLYFVPDNSNRCFE